MKVEDYMHTTLMTITPEALVSTAYGDNAGQGLHDQGRSSSGAPILRAAYRSSLQGHYTVPNLGFRCAKDVEEQRQ